MTTLTKEVFYQKWSETVTEYKWTLHNFSTCNEKYISHIFSNKVSDFENDLKWEIALYPDGKSDSDKGNVSIFLFSKNDFVVSVNWEITLSCNIVIYGTRRLNSTFKNSYGWGYNHYISRDILLKDLKKGNDILTINLKMLFSKKPKNPQLNLIQNLKTLLNTEKNSDIILISKDGKKHKAHKAILMCRSKVFSAMFQHDMKESRENVIKIEDIDNEALRAMLLFIYTGEVKDIQDNAQKLFIAADKYELNDLKEICVDYLCENIIIDNVLDLIEFSHIYSICDLEKKAKDYFLKNHKKVMLTKGLRNIKELSRHTVNHLLYDLAVYEESGSSASTLE